MTGWELHLEMPKWSRFLWQMNLLNYGVCYHYQFYYVRQWKVRSSNSTWERYFSINKATYHVLHCIHLCLGLMCHVPQQLIADKSCCYPPKTTWICHFHGKVHQISLGFQFSPCLHPELESKLQLQRPT